MSQVGLLVEKAVGEAALDAIQFPISLRVPSALTTGEGEDIGAAEIEVTFGEGAEPTELGVEFERFITEMAQGVQDGSVDVEALPADQLKALRTIAASFKEGRNPRSGPMTAGNQQEIRDALGVLVNKKTVSLDIEWVKIDVEKPAITLDNPIVLSGMVVHVQARVKACVKVGVQFCAKITSPRIRLEARRLNLALSGQGPKVMAMPSFNDLDFVLKIKIYKWSFDVRIGITSIVNGQLRKQGALQILDMSFLQQQIPYSTKKARISGFSFPSNPAGLDVKASLSFD